MRTAHYNVLDEQRRPKHYLVVYDETKPCCMCGLPVGEFASVSATAICGSCDNGTPRIPEWQIRKRLQGKKITPEAAWSNKVQEFLFDSREECDQKIYELHQQDITGWPHIIERINQQRNRRV